MNAMPNHDDIENALALTLAETLPGAPLTWAQEQSDYHREEAATSLQFIADEERRMASVSESVARVIEKARAYESAERAKSQMIIAARQDAVAYHQAGLAALAGKGA